MKFERGSDAHCRFVSTRSHDETLSGYIRRPVSFTFSGKEQHMKSSWSLRCAAAILTVCALCTVSDAQSVKQRDPIIKNIYTADPSAHVFNGKLYIYPSHDIDGDVEYSGNGDQYDMKDYHVYSMNDINSPVTDHGMVLHLKDVPWASAQMWAPDAAYRNNKYYLYFPARDKDKVFRIGVAVSNTPTGPFKALPEYIRDSYSIDPAVFVDDDGKAYMFFGGLWGGQLEKWKSGAFKADDKEPGIAQPALGPRVAVMKNNMTEFDGPSKEVSIVDEEGNKLLSTDHDRRFFEAAWIHKYNGVYYLSYSTGNTHYIVYATSKKPMGPYTYKGIILNPVRGWTTHHSIVKFNDKWYLFYHDCTLSQMDHLRCVKFTELKYNADGTIKTIDPYQ